MRISKKFSLGAALTLSGAFLLSACSSPAGAAEVEPINAQIAEIQASIDAAREALAAHGIVVAEVAAPVAAANADAATPISPSVTGDFVLANDLEVFAARALHLSSWPGIPMIDGNVWDAAMRSCMSNKGLPFHSRTHLYARDSREFAETYGFDIVASNFQVWVDVTAEMTDAERSAYWDAQSVCSTQASELSNVFWEVANDFNDVRNDLWTVWEYDPRETVFMNTWRACMVDAGFSPAEESSWWDIHTLTSPMWNELHEARQAPVDQAILNNWDWTADPQGPRSTAVDEFAEREITMAVTNWDCLNDMNYRAMRNVINRERLDAVITAFGPQLQEWMEAYDAAIAAATA